MAYLFSTGSPGLDSLLEELRAGDNVVFYTPDRSYYLPFVRALSQRPANAAPRVIYARSTGCLDAEVGSLSDLEVLDLNRYAAAADPTAALQQAMHAVGRGVHYVFESLDSIPPAYATPGALADFFTAICPLLYQLETVCYWDLRHGAHGADTIARIKDCTQVFLQLDLVDGDPVITPAKVWGRYSEAMFLPHRLWTSDGSLALEPVRMSVAGQRAYAHALEEKNRELAEIRDALDAANQALQERNRSLGELNARLSEQTHRYEALHRSLDQLLALVQAGQTISASLAEDQVRGAIVAATMRLFDAPACRLELADSDGAAPIRVEQGVDAAWSQALDAPPIVALRAGARQSLQACGTDLVRPDGLRASLGLAPLAARGRSIGILEVCSADGHFVSEEVIALLAYLASGASIALDHAYLYREVESQGHQLRSFVEEVISNEEQESRRIAYDLHDGLVQLIVAAFQHLQSAVAWRSRDIGQEERELEQSTQLLKRAIYEARRLIGQLRPTGLDDFGLVHALRLHVAQLAQDAEWEVALDVSPTWPELPATLEAALFRIIQEATTNAFKYADTERLDIALKREGGWLVAHIRDWGKGFDPSLVPEGPAQGRHIGLIGMRERARLWGGACSIDSGEGRGTTVSVRIPLPEPLAPDAHGEAQAR